MPRAARVWLLVGWMATGCSGTALEPGQCRDALACGLAEFCRRPTGACQVPGMCSPRPEVCTRIHRPVCGCDAVEYASACVAHAAGESIAHEGGCTP